MTERSDDLYRVSMLNEMFAAVAIVDDDVDDGVVVEKQCRGTGPNFAIQTLTDRNNIDVAGMTVKGQMKK